MNKNTAFIRKISYIVAIALLLIPLSWLSQPAAKSAATGRTSAGGKLAQLRAEHDLSQAELGDIDPASETMKLATLGLRGVASLVLWEQANEASKKKNWDKLRATLNQIVKLQPNFVYVWEFQAHNLSYNVSVEFDDYRQRYHWVKKGIDFLIEGTKFNRNEPKLLWNLGFFMGQKIGRSDELLFFRRLYRKDDEFHELLRQHIPIDKAIVNNEYDNWLTAREWYLKCYHLIEFKGATFRGRGPLIYYADAPMSLINYALSLQDEEDPGELEVPRRAWTNALEAWRAFGDRRIRTSFDTYIKLNSLDEVERRFSEVEKEFNDLLPGIEEKLRRESMAGFPDDVKVLFDKPETELTNEEHIIKHDWERKLIFNRHAIADAAPDELRRKARSLAVKVDEADAQRRHVDSYRGTINYDFWEKRCLAESSEDGLRAREAMYDAHQLYLDTVLVKTQRQKRDVNGNLELGADGQPVLEWVDGAQETYEKAWDLWAKVFEKYPGVESRTIAEQLAPAIVEYREVLIQQELDLPEDFKLKGILDIRNGDDGLPTSELLKQIYETKRKKDEKDEKDKATDDGKAGPNPDEPMPKSDEAKSTDKKDDSSSKRDPVDPATAKKPDDPK